MEPVYILYNAKNYTKGWLCVQSGKPIKSNNVIGL